MAKKRILANVVGMDSYFDNEYAGTLWKKMLFYDILLEVFKDRFQRGA